jgi:hypothetical protein
MEVFFKIRIIFLCVLYFTVLSGLAKHQQLLPEAVRYQEQTDDHFNLLINVHADVNATEKEALSQKLENFIRKLRRKQHRYKSEERLVRYIFYKVHNRYLKHYRQHTDLYELLDKGYYDCITGTAFYAMIFDALDIDYRIHELPYHVYMTVDVKDKSQDVLLESTDGMAGFVSDPQEIASRKAVYAQEAEQEDADFYQYGFEIKEVISLQQLAALNYYNEAVIYYNQQQLDKASTYLEQAQQLYPAPRMEALQNLIDQVARQQLATADR